MRSDRPRTLGNRPCLPHYVVWIIPRTKHERRNGSGVRRGKKSRDQGKVEHALLVEYRDHARGKRVRGYLGYLEELFAVYRARAITGNKGINTDIAALLKFATRRDRTCPVS